MLLAAMRGHECYHCKQWVAEGEPHDCWTTTEAALTADLSEDLRDAWERLRESAASLGEQRIYASHKSIMFSRAACYCFVRPKRNVLEVCVFLGRALTAPQVRRSDPASRHKIANTLHIRHRDEVEAPITDWIREAYEFSERRPAATARSAGRSAVPQPVKTARPVAAAGRTATAAGAKKKPPASKTKPATKKKLVAKPALPRTRRQ